MTKSQTITILATLAIAFSPAWGQEQKKKQAASPPATTSITVDGKEISIKYGAPSRRDRKMFGPDGRISQDPNYPVWRAGANSATVLHTEADLEINGLAVPKGDYTLFAKVDEPVWDFIVSKELGQWGLAYKAANDLGRVKMKMSKPAATIETYKMMLSSGGGKKAKLQLEFEDVIATVDIVVK